jgi:hypothetical protein
VNIPRINPGLIETGTRYTGRTGGSRRDIVVSGLVVLGLLALNACDDDDGAAAAVAVRPSVTFTATDTALEVPDEVPAGFVDIELETAPGDVGHHLVIARLNDGVTLEEALAGGDEAFFTMMTIKGGNGTIAAGENLSMTLELEPGNYFALDNPQLPEPVIAPFAVVESEWRGEEPESEGVVTLGPGMVIAVPDDFDATGTWEFVNEDPDEPHEAALVRLADGKTAADVATWGHGGFAGPPPFVGEFGSMGALGPGERAWITIEPGEPGEYALICFVPGRDGVPHLGQGMVTQVTVEG